MKTKSASLVMIGMLITGSVLAAVIQSGEDLFQKALLLERNQGKLNEAIELYKKVVAGKESETLAVQAQLRIGMCYEKLGRDSIKQAQKAFQKVIDNYPEQTMAVNTAKEKLSFLLRTQPAAKPADKEFRIRKVFDYARMGSRGNMGRPSPDGRYLLYSDMYSLNLCVVEFATQKKHFITKEAVISPSKRSSSKKPIEFHSFRSIWSQSSKMVAYNWIKFKDVYDYKDAWDEQGNYKDAVTELRIIGLDGSNPRVIYSTEDWEEVNPLDWSSDGRYILAEFISRSDARELVMISVEDSSIRVLKKFDKRPPRDGFSIGELFSPDGRHVVFDSKQNNSSNRDIFLLSKAGSIETALVQHPSNDFVLGWTPDGQNLIFASDRTGTLSIWAKRVSEGKPHEDPVLIKKDIGDIWPKGFDKHGSFYYANETTVSDIYTAKMDNESNKILTQPKKASQRFVGSAMYPDWSPDGKYLAYVYISYPKTEYEANRFKAILLIRSIENGQERELYPEPKYIRGTCWSPDGRYILTVGSEIEDQEGFYTIDVKTEDTAAILKFNKGDILGVPVWSQDGKKIFYMHQGPQKKIASIMMYNLSSKEKMEIHRENFQRAHIPTGPFFPQDLSLSPDGQFLVFNLRDRKTHEPILKVISVSGGETREVVRLERGKIIETADWTPDGKSLIFAESKFQRGYEFDFWKISVEGGKAQNLGLQMDRVYIMRIHPDGQNIAFQSAIRKKEIYAMDNFLPTAHR